MLVHLLVWIINCTRGTVNTSKYYLLLFARNADRSFVRPQDIVPTDYASLSIIYNTESLHQNLSDEFNPGPYWAISTSQLHKNQHDIHKISKRHGPSYSAVN